MNGPETSSRGPGRRSDRQRESDRRYGTRAALSRRLAELERALAELGDARREALEPLPELPALIRDVAGEIERVRRALGLPVPPNAAADELLARINAADTIEDVEEIRAFVAQAADLGVVSGEDLGRLYAKIRDRAGALYDRHLAAGVARPAAAGPAPLRALEVALAGDGDFLLLVDGHNLLFRLEEQGAAVAAGDHAARREALAQAVAALFRADGRPCARVYFDAPEDGQSSVSARVQVIYAGGEGEHRADRRIVEDLEYARQREPGSPRAVVTADRELGRAAAGLGAAVIRPGESPSCSSVSGRSSPRRSTSPRP